PREAQRRERWGTAACAAVLPAGDGGCCQRSTMLRASDLDYDLPPDLIATHPARPRDSARLMVVSRSASSRVEHRVVRQLPELLSTGDLLVFNTTRVAPARLRGVRESTGGRVEGLYIRDEEPARPGGMRWVMLVKARHLRPGMRIELIRE